MTGGELLMMLLGLILMVVPAVIIGLVGRESNHADYR
jgi:hypothetical protein